jgi:oxygen-dependent protoporphyrinogen oxidase
VAHIAIIGAGLAGLGVAHRRVQAGDRVTIFEAAERLGGQLHSERAGDFVIEHGAEGFVFGSSVVAELARSVGAGGAIIDQLVRDSCEFDGQRLIRLSPGEAGKLLGFQVGSRALGRGIQSFRLGMSELVEDLERALGERVSWRRGCRVQSLQRHGGTQRWSVQPEHGAAEAADRVVVATQASNAAQLLVGEFGARARELENSEALSSVTVSLAYPRPAVPHPLDATGFVVAEGAQREGFRACTFVSTKLAGRAPASHALLRLFFRPAANELGMLSDAAWRERAERCAKASLGIETAAERAWISRWDRALPVFDAAHRARVAALESALAGSGVVLAGAAFHGSGIEGAVQSAERAARALDG